MDNRRSRGQEGTHTTTTLNGRDVNFQRMNGQNDNMVSMDEVRERMQRLKQNVMQELNDVVDDVVEGIEAVAKNGKPVGEKTREQFYIDKKKSDDSGELLDKHFETRNSVLSDLFNETKHLAPIYRVWIAMLILLCMHTVVHDLLETGEINVGLKTIAIGFGKFPEVMKIWFIMNSLCLGVYIMHSFWAHQRIKIHQNLLITKLWDYTWLIIFIIYQLNFLCVPPKIIFHIEFPPPSSLIIVLEQARMFMKVHAFVRSTSPKVINYKPHTEGKEFSYPEFSKFLYFMFAPTLVYRNSYPRTKKIRWSFVAWHFAEVIFTIFFIAFLTERCFIPTFQDFGLRPYTIKDYVAKVFHTLLPGLALFLCGFYCLLHAWLNAWSEMLTFGDRMFYKDWWNASSFAAYYRRWNVVVHDWLYTYVYRDFYNIIFPGNRFLSSCIVFLISAAVHEYVLTVAFRLFYPVMFVVFGLYSQALVYIPKKYVFETFGNCFLWWSLCGGNGVVVSLYAIEYYARINCPTNSENFSDLFVPRSWFCQNSTAVS